MKKDFLILFFVGLTLNISASDRFQEVICNYEDTDSVVCEQSTNNILQNESIHEVPEEKIYDVVEQICSFPGGDDAMMYFIYSHIQYPAKAKKKEKQGTVIVNFTVESDGSISDVKVVKHVCHSLDKEAIRIVKSMPKWKPYMHNGIPSRCVGVSVPVVFSLK